MKRLLLAAAAAVSVLALSACQDDATTANYNLSKEADNFKIMRNIVFYNTWTDTEVVQVTGLCSIEDKGDKLWATCKEPGGFKRHSMGRSANLTYFSVQLEAADVSVYHTKIIWKPQSFIPDIDIRGDSEELLSTDHMDK